MLIRIAAIWMAIGVAAGAFGAHALADRLPQWYSDPAVAERRSENWQTAVEYQLASALGGLFAGLAAALARRRGGAVVICGALLLLGSAIFSGCLYALVLSDQRWLGAVVPLGGVLQLVGWLGLAWSAPRAVIERK